MDTGAAWTEITDTEFLPVSDLALTENALYIGFEGGFITKTTSFIAGDFVLVNDASVLGSIQSGMWTVFATVSGTSAAADTLYVGTTVWPGLDNWGFFVSPDGGATFSGRNDGLDGNSVFSLSVDPFDPHHLVCGTIGGGIYITSDAGVTWARSSGLVYATDSLGFAEDPADPLPVCSDQPTEVQHGHGLIKTSILLAWYGGFTRARFQDGCTLRCGTAGSSGWITDILPSRTCHL